MPLKLEKLTGTPRETTFGAPLETTPEQRVNICNFAIVFRSTGTDMSHTHQIIIQKWRRLAKTHVASGRNKY